VQPITPTWRKEPFDDPDWLFDFKYDGFRALYYIEPGHNRLISRNGNLLTRFDVLAGALAAELNVDDAIIDGEVIAADETGRPQCLRSPPRHAGAGLCRVRYRLVRNPRAP
jgi:bifunctional non-homologous end joining protein LigD